MFGGGSARLATAQRPAPEDSVLVRGIFLAAALFAFAAAPAWPQEVLRIAAVVNDRAISMFDLEMRVNVALYNANLAPTDEMRRRVAGPVLRNLIDEALQAEEARGKGIRVTERDLAEAVAHIEDGNGVPRGGLEAFLAERGIAAGAVTDQIRSQIAWGKYVSQRLRPTIAVSEEEIDEELVRLEAMRGRPEYLVSEIALYDDPATNPADLRATAGSIVAQLRGGADFAAVAAQFSQGSLARGGGDLGWIQEGRGRDEIERALASMEIGAVSDPIRAIDGWHIVHLRDKRAVLSTPVEAIELFLAQILLPAGEGETPGAAERRLALARHIADESSGCDALRARGAALENALSGDVGWVNLADLPGAFRESLRDIEVGAAAAPLVTANGVHVLMACDRRDRGDEIDVRDTIYDRIARRRLEIVERRLMRDLRRTAFVDLRV